MSAYRVQPITGRRAIKWIEETHRHLPKPQGALFAVAVCDSTGQTVGVGTCGNPPPEWEGTGRIVISRVAVQPDLPSVGEHAAPAVTMIYGALSQAAKALGYHEVWTYTLPEEPGTSLRAAGFIEKGMSKGGDWVSPSKPGRKSVRPEPKRRWMRVLREQPRGLSERDLALLRIAVLV